MNFAKKNQIVIKQKSDACRNKEIEFSDPATNQKKQVVSVKLNSLTLRSMKKAAGLVGNASNNLILYAFIQTFLNKTNL